MYGEQKKSESPHRPFYLQNMNSWDASTSRGAVRLQKVGGEHIYKPLALEITDINPYILFPQFLEFLLPEDAAGCGQLAVFRGETFGNDLLPMF